jgi:hypothetical protein
MIREEKFGQAPIFLSMQDGVAPPPAQARVRRQSRSSSLMLVLARVFSSTVLTITAQ